MKDELNKIGSLSEELKRSLRSIKSRALALGKKHRKSEDEAAMAELRKKLSS